ncbi:MAG TPA: cohesin domain-containing protein, partial [Anaerolineales bacterium]|nr:cohesin domain-containing protein [Anaerolineales bacterium]
MRVRVYAVLFFILGLPLLVSCQGGTSPSSPTTTPTRTLVPSATLPPPTATDTPYPTDTPSPRPPTNTLSATLTQTWPETPSPTPTITRTPTQTLTWTPSPTVTGTPPTTTPTPSVTPTLSGSETPTFTPTPSMTATSSDQPLVWVSPDTQTVQVNGQPGQALIQLSNFTDVYDMDLQLSYDTDLITIIDANTSQTGTQVLPGTCPQPDQVFINIVDTEEGNIDYQVSQVDPTPPCDEGIVVTVNFTCIANGTAFLFIDDTFIVDGNGEELTHEVEDGLIFC